MIVVGVSGYKGAGKDAVADILVRDHGFTKMAFADPLKRMIEKLDPILGYHKEYCCENCDAEVEEVRLSTLLAYGMTQEEIKRDFMYGAELRRLWQGFGTDVMRADDEDYWVNRASIALAQTAAERVVFTDVRFENEADFIYDQRSEFIGGQSSVWRIARPSQHPTDVHISEQMVGLLGEEDTILNDGSLEDLAEAAAMAMDFVLCDDSIPGQLAFDFTEGTNE
jgi:hypothetical protein